MFYSTLTVRFDPASGSFDDARFDEFAKSKELLTGKQYERLAGELNEEGRMLGGWRRAK